MVFIESNRPRPIDWNPTFALNDKIPFGLYVLDKEADKLFSKQKITKISKTPYEFFDDKYDYSDSTYTVKGDVLYVNNDFTIDDSSVDELFYFASRGNNIFLSASNFPNNLRDSLHFEIKRSSLFSDSIALNVTNPYLKPKEFHYSKGFSINYFSIIDTTQTIILGQQLIEGEKQTNFIKVPYRKGFFYLHLQPIAFTNYNMLKDENYKYVEQLSSYLTQDEVFWFSKFYNSKNINQSPMRYFLSQPGLRWAWYISIISIFIFIIFNAKRKQRVIPIIEPVRNTTVDFTKTIGNLYYQERNHKNIIDKKIIFFLEKIRNEYLLDTHELNESFVNRYQQKSRHKKEDILELIRLIKLFRNKEIFNESDVINLNNAIEKLNKKATKNIY